MFLAYLPEAVTINYVILWFVAIYNSIRNTFVNRGSLKTCWGKAENFEEFSTLDNL